MEALATLSLAANILQLIDFTSKLFSTGYQLQKVGKSQLEFDLGGVVRDLGDVTRRLTLSLHPPGVHLVLTADEQALYNLGASCVNLTDELILKLESLCVDPKHKSKWRTFRLVLKVFWEEEKILSTYKRLGDLRAEMILTLSMITKKSIDLAALAQQEGFKRLDLQTYIIIRKLVETPDALMKTMKAHSQELVHRHEESDALAIRLQQQTLDAIYGSTPRQPDVSVEETRQNVIDILKFRQMSAREDDIADAHHKTFQWILAEEAHGGASFSALMPWLRKAHGTYWITGKAGSGKSTLMKFLGANEKVKDALQSWASPQKLIVASFYFWRSGTLLQRSQEGLLRSLLHTILDQRRDLVRICFPEQFDQIEVYNRKASETVLGLELVTKAFKRLSCSDLSELRVCLFIDAVDEFEGDHEEMSKFFQDLASTPAIKIILSSRATPMYTEAFGSLPSLLLQDLTHHDIKTYVEAIIGRHARMEMLLSENKHEASRLIGAILSKASGVFLWVRLVVKSLLDGFRNYDRICDLQERVHECPQELGNLYNHMFHSMEPRYQKHSAQLLRIVVRSIEVQKDKALTILQLSFADDGDLQRALDAPVSLITEAEREARSVAMTGRIRSRCCGLVEIRDSVVELIHSSVLDFLLGGEVWGAVLTLTPLFDPNAVLIAAILMNIKVNSTEELDLKIALSHFQRYCELREKLAPGSRAGAIAELKRVLLLQEPNQAPELFDTLCPENTSRGTKHRLEMESPSSTEGQRRFNLTPVAHEGAPMIGFESQLLIENSDALTTSDVLQVDFAKKNQHLCTTRGRVLSHQAVPDSIPSSSLITSPLRQTRTRENNLLNALLTDQIKNAEWNIQVANEIGAQKRSKKRKEISR